MISILIDWAPHTINTLMTCENDNNKFIVPDTKKY